MSKDIFSNDIVIFDSRKTENSKLKNKNGAFRSKDGSIWIDINAEQGLLGALSHELTHFMKSLNNAKFKEIANILIDEYGKARVLLEDVIKDYMTKLDCSRELAFEEYVCDCMTKMLSDTNAAETLARLRIADRKIADGFIKYIHKAIDGIKAFLKNKDDKQFGNLTLQLNQLQHIADIWAEGVAGAMSEFENKQKKNTASGNDGEILYSIKNIVDINGKDYGIGVYLDSELFNGLNDEERKTKLKEFVVNNLAGKHFIAYDNNSNAVDIKISDKNAKFKNSNNKKIRTLKELYHKNNGIKIKQEAVVLADELIETAKYEKKGQVNYPHGVLDNYGKNDWEYWKVFIEDKNNNIAVATLNIATNNENQKILYDVYPIKKIGQAKSLNPILAAGSIKSDPTSANNTLPHTSEKVKVENENNEKFSMKSTVEETKDLIAVHNVEEKDLMKSLGLGGLPMPSIAVVKAESGHSEFGSISLLFNKDTIDPKLNKNNKVYSGDAWTPTVPRTSYKLNEKKAEEIRKRIDSVLKGTGFDTAYGYLSLDNDNMNDFLERNDGELKKYYKTKTPIKYAFLKESGIDVEPAYENAALDTSNSAMENDFIIEIAEKYGKDKINDFHSESKKITDEIVDELMQLANKYIERTEPKSVYTTRTGRYKPFYNENNFGFFKADNIFNAAYKYLKYGVKQTIDTTITDNIINDLILAHKNEYENWLDDVFGGVVEKEGIRNNKDMFTPSGNRRSFEALHYEITLENIVKAMKEQEETGNSFFSGLGIWGVSTKKYKSVDEIKADKDRLKNISKEYYRKKREAFLNRLIDISNSALVDVDVIIDTIRTRKTKSGMLSYLQEYTKKATAATVDDIVSLVKDISNMPTEYFEAKPHRAVGFDEVVKAVIPKNSSNELKTALENKGIDFVEYEAGNETDRLNKINEVEDIRFSEKTDSTIKEQIKSHSAELNRMNSVFSIEKSDGFSSGKNALDWVMEKLKGYGKLINRQGFGNVELDEKRVRNGCRYFEPYNKHLNEIIAFAAVPKVIKQGIEVGKHIEHKGRDYNTITFAAPITINGIRNNMAVVVRIEGKKYYKVHRVVLPDGSQLTFEQNKKDTAHSAGGVDNNSGLSQKANVFSINNIPENYKEVKPDLFSTKEIRTDIDIDVAEEYIKINRELEKENAKLKELVKLQKERARQQGKITNGKIIRPSSISAQAVLLKKQYGISGVKGNTELEALLKTYYDYVIDHADTDDINLFTLEQTMRQAKPVSDWIISKIEDKQQINSVDEELNTFNDIDLERSIKNRYIDV